jgi:uncharacterized membrane protein YkvA (DUF1232 family)
MSRNKTRQIIQPKGGVFQDLSVRIKLILRLMGDKRVSPFLKLIPIGTLVYLVVPDLVIGPLDDALIIWLGLYLFVELCPPDVVKEHMEAIRSSVVAEWKEASPEADNEIDEEDIVEGEFHED